MPKARYLALNTYGVTVSSSLVVTDDVTKQPLKNVSVTIGSSAARTDKTGKASFDGLRLGPAKLTIARPGFETITRDITLGWGSNPLGTLGLQAGGMRYTFAVRDYVTGKGIKSVEISSGDATALSDKDGIAVLTLPGTVEAEITADIIANGYRQETVTAKPSEDVTAATAVKLVTSRRAVYVSTEHGTYDVMASDVDGRNKQIILPGTGSETSNISLAVSPDGAQAALVTTRGQKDDTGSLLASLVLIDVSDGDNVTIAQGVQIRLLDWVGTRLLFEQAANDKDKPVEHTIVSYDYPTSSRLLLARAASFSAVLTARGDVYYANRNDPARPADKPSLMRISANGSNRSTVFETEVWSAYRTDYHALAVQTPDGWHTVNIDGGGTSPAAPPTSFTSRIYTERQTQGNESLWATVQNGEGVLQLHTRQDGRDVTIHRQAGLANPVRWLTDEVVIYRVVTGAGTADYVIGVQPGSTPYKVADVVNTYGFTAGP